MIAKTPEVSACCLSQLVESMAFGRKRDIVTKSGIFLLWFEFNKDKLTSRDRHFGNKVPKSIHKVIPADYAVISIAAQVRPHVARRLRANKLELVAECLEHSSESISPVYWRVLREMVADGLINGSEFQLSYRYLCHRVNSD